MCRRAFTLFDLIVLVTAGGIGAGLLVPVIGKVRQSASRAQSQNNLKQIGIACYSYSNAYNKFPAGVDANGFSASARLLPFIEQATVFEKIDFTKKFDDKKNAAARMVVVPLYLSPLDPVRSVSADWGATNYVFSAGTKDALAKNDGVFYLDSTIRIANITDGISSTMMTAETLKGDSGLKAMDVRRQHVLYKKDDLGRLKPESGVADFKNNKHIAADRGASWMDGSFLQGTFTTTRTLNDPRPDVNCGGAGGLSGLRSLSDGTCVGMCDGSVRYVSKSIAFSVWQALATRAGGEGIQDF
jgi:hypothetical protein